MTFIRVWDNVVYRDIMQLGLSKLLEIELTCNRK